MKRKDIFKKLIDENGAIFLLGNGYCPCGHIEIMGIRVETHCWRSSCKDEHPFSCVHISQDTDMNCESGELMAIAKMFAKEIKESFSTAVDIKVDKSL